MTARPRKPPPKRFTWGGRREGAGRKPKGERAGVPHRPRPEVSPRHPAHVVLRMLPLAGTLRSRRAFSAVASVFATNREKEGFRLVHFALQPDQIHLVVEADDADRLSRGMQGIALWISRRLNELLGRRGKIFADRFESQVLRTPAEVRRALGGVLGAGRDPYACTGPEGPGLTAAPRSALLRGFSSCAGGARG